MNNINNDKGWECPKCNKVFAPWVSECNNCKSQLKCERCKGTGIIDYIPFRGHICSLCGGSGKKTNSTPGYEGKI